VLADRYSIVTAIVVVAAITAASTREPYPPTHPTTTVHRPPEGRP
jgi:hypothetical protein